MEELIKHAPQCHQWYTDHPEAAECEEQYIWYWQGAILHLESLTMPGKMACDASASIEHLPQDTAMGQSPTVLCLTCITRIPDSLTMFGHDRPGQ